MKKTNPNIFNKEDEFSKQVKDTKLEIFQNRLIKFFGSWVFLILNLAFFVGWVLLNLNYELLTFLVSLEAIILAILLLIHSNLEQESDRQRAIKDYKIDLSIAKKVKRIDQEIKEIKNKLS
jgi:uncharacterized membrane protein